MTFNLDNLARTGRKYRHVGKPPSCGLSGKAGYR